MAEAVKERVTETDYTIGHTRVKICCDCCRQSEEEIQEILKRIARRAMDAFSLADVS